VTHVFAVPIADIPFRTTRLLLWYTNQRFADVEKFAELLPGVDIQPLFSCRIDFGKPEQITLPNSIDHCHRQQTSLKWPEALREYAGMSIYGEKNRKDTQ
jgi:hypothetical protein